MEFFLPACGAGHLQDVSIVHEVPDSLLILSRVYSHFKVHVVQKVRLTYFSPTFELVLRYRSVAEPDKSEQFFSEWFAMTKDARRLRKP